MQQKTIKNAFFIEGIGIHTGKKVSLNIFAAPQNSGVAFIRTDKNNAKIKVCPQNVLEFNRATILSNGKEKIFTPEHLLAAIYALGIDNLIIEIDNEEVPILDGAASYFAEKLQKAQIIDLEEEKKPLVISEEMKFVNDKAEITVLPDPNFKITFTVEYPNTFIGTQQLTIIINPETFTKEIAPARTYGFYAEYKDLLEKNLAKGASIDNALVIGDNDYLNEPRFIDEIVRHKILDLVGDLAILNKPILGHFLAKKSGHALNAKLITHLQKYSN
jgi:UDP-3-O-[3-hydroxymyristoyl] N-acetylglucosamine deacetylase